MGMNASQPANNKQRELYVGNVPTGAVSESMMKELFAQMLNQCLKLKADLGAPVLNVQVRTGGAASGNGTGATFAFVEFRDEVRCDDRRLQRHGLMGATQSRGGPWPSSR